MRLVLASTSRYRRQLLSRLGLPFECRAPQVNEEAVQEEEELSPRELAVDLAARKAMSLIESERDSTLIGSDQVAACGGEILSKPGEMVAAREQLQLLSGQSHQLFTAVAVWHGGQLQQHLEIATLRMRTLTDEEIDRYLDADQPFDCAGSYKLEERGIALFESVSAADHSAITGLPLIALSGMLRRLGYAIP